MSKDVFQNVCSYFLWVPKSTPWNFANLPAWGLVLPTRNSSERRCAESFASGSQDVLRCRSVVGVAKWAVDSALSWGCLKYVFNDQEILLVSVQNLHGRITTRARHCHWHTRITRRLRFDSRQWREINRFEATQCWINPFRLPRYPNFNEWRLF